LNGLIASREDELKALCERHGAERLAVFGSALRRDFSIETSDLDFVVEFPATMPSDHHAAAYFELLEDLESLFKRRVDLVEFGAVRNPYLRREIEEQQETLVGCCGCSRPEGVEV
jgi:predicted nucleotidyltransferase